MKKELIRIEVNRRLPLIFLRRAISASLAAIALMTASMEAVYAAGQFELDFQPEPGFSLPFPTDNDIGNNDPTPFRIEEGTVNVGGSNIRFIHMIVSDPASGFAQEVFIKGTGPLRNQGDETWQMQDAGGSIGTAGKNGNCRDQSQFFSPGGACYGNNADPLGADENFTGNSTGNPTSVEMRQVMGGTWNATTNTWACDTEFCAEFLKDTLMNKPKITQKISTVDMNAAFIADMSAISYSDALTPATVANTLTFTDPNASGFDSATDTQSSAVTAGQFTFTPGTGWDSNGTVYDSGVYSYSSGNFDLTAPDWDAYCDPSQNTWTSCTDWSRRSTAPRR